MHCKGNTFFARFQANRHRAVSQNDKGATPLWALVIHFLSGPPERKPNQKKELENVLSSEAVTQILQITQCARLCRFACKELATLKQHFVFRCSDCKSNQRLNIDSKNLHYSKDLFVRNVFRGLGAMPPLRQFMPDLWWSEHTLMKERRVGAVASLPWGRALGGWCFLLVLFFCAERKGQILLVLFKKDIFRNIKKMNK